MADTWARIRERAGLTQRNVADALGIDRASVSYWETGARPMDARWLNVVGYFDQTVHDLAPLLGFEVKPLGYRVNCCDGVHVAALREGDE